MRAAVVTAAATAAVGSAAATAEAVLVAREREIGPTGGKNCVRASFRGATTSATRQLYASRQHNAPRTPLMWVNHSPADRTIPEEAQRMFL